MMRTSLSGRQLPIRSATNSEVILFTSGVSKRLSASNANRNLAGCYVPSEAPSSFDPRIAPAAEPPIDRTPF